MRLRFFSRVVFPLPFMPRIPMISPGTISMLAFSSTRRS